MKYKHFASFLAAIVIVFVATPPTTVTAISNEVSNARLEEINELIDLAAAAARRGETELAFDYESQAAELGAEVLSLAEAVALEKELSGETDTVSTRDVAKPINTSDVHFYKTTSLKYYYSVDGNYYDIITIRAVPWTPNNAWLNTTEVITVKGTGTYEAAAGVSLAIIKAGITSYSTIASVADFLADFGEAISSYSSMTISNSGGSCTYTLGMDVAFQWASPHGEDNYVLCVRESRYSNLDYSVTLIGTVTRTTGQQVAHTYTKEYSTVYTPSGYLSQARICQAYVAGTVAEYNVGGYSVYVGDTKVSFPYLNIPPSFDLLY